MITDNQFVVPKIYIYIFKLYLNLRNPKIIFTITQLSLILLSSGNHNSNKNQPNQANENFKSNPLHPCFQSLWLLRPQLQAQPPPQWQPRSASRTPKPTVPCSFIIVNCHECLFPQQRSGSQTTIVSPLPRSETQSLPLESSLNRTAINDTVWSLHESSIKGLEF